MTAEKGTTTGYLLLTEAGAVAVERVSQSIVRYPRSRAPVLMPIIRHFDPLGTTDDVRFMTRKVVMDPPPH